MKINIKNTDKLEKAIQDAQKRAHVRTIEYYNIVNACNVVEKHLSIPKTRMNNISFWCDPNAETFKGSYKGIPESTIFECAYHNGNWYLVDIKRGQTFAKTIKYRVSLTEEAKQAILDRCKWFCD